MTTCTKCGAEFPGDIECVNGIAIDIDVFMEGWERDVSYPPAPCHPAFCKTCGGSGWNRTDRGNSDDCPDCDGRGYRGDNDCQERLEAAAQTDDGEVTP